MLVERYFHAGRAIFTSMGNQSTKRTQVPHEYDANCRNRQQARKSRETRGHGHADLYAVSSPHEAGLTAHIRHLTVGTDGHQGLGWHFMMRISIFSAGVLSPKVSWHWQVVLVLYPLSRSDVRSRLEVVKRSSPIEHRGLAPSLHRFGLGRSLLNSSSARRT